MIGQDAWEAFGDWQWQGWQVISRVKGNGATGLHSDGPYD